MLKEKFLLYELITSLPSTKEMLHSWEKFTKKW